MDTLGLFVFNSVYRLNSFKNDLPISLGLGANQPKIRSISIRGSTSVVFVVLASCTTVSTGASTRSCGRIVVLTPTFCVFSLPTCVFAAMFGPPPVSKLRGLAPHPARLTKPIHTKSQSTKRKDRPHQDFNSINIFSLHNISQPYE